MRSQLILLILKVMLDMLSLWPIIQWFGFQSCKLQLCFWQWRWILLPWLTAALISFMLLISFSFRIGSWTDYLSFDFNASSQKDNACVLMLIEMLLPEFTPWLKHCASKIMLFHAEIHEQGIKLLNIDTYKQQGVGGHLYEKAALATFGCLWKWLMGW